MASQQLKQMNELYATIKEWLSKPDIALATRRDIAETVHLAASEPEAVTYAEVDAGGVPALWCIPEGYDPARVLLHSHAGGTVVTSMHTDRKALGHIAKVVGARALVWITGVRQSTSSPRRSMTWRGRIAGSLPEAFAPRTLPASAILLVATLP